MVNWSHTFDNIAGPHEEDFFAYTYPYSYNESLAKTQNMLKRLKDSDSVYMHREVLFRSAEGREMELITLSSYKGITEEREAMIDADGLLPWNGTVEKRPFKFVNKKCIFLTSRVHPGETAASYMLNGILIFLNNKNTTPN